MSISQYPYGMALLNFLFIDFVNTFHMPPYNGLKSLSMCGQARHHHTTVKYILIVFDILSFHSMQNS